MGIYQKILAAARALVGEASCVPHSRVLRVPQARNQVGRKAGKITFPKIFHKEAGAEPGRSEMGSCVL